MAEGLEENLTLAQLPGWKEKAVGILRSITGLTTNKKTTEDAGPIISIPQQNPQAEPELKIQPQSKTNSPSKLSRTERRAQKQAAYLAQKSKEANIEQRKQKEKLPKDNPMVNDYTRMEDEMSEETLTVTNKDMPWLAKDRSYTIPLTPFNLEGSPATGYVADFFEDQSGTLETVAKELAPQNLSSIETATRNQLALWFQAGTITSSEQISNKFRKTEKSIYKLDIGRDKRVYFMRFDNINGKMAILRVAICNKSNNHGQERVYGVITNIPKSQLKRFAAI